MHSYHPNRRGFALGLTGVGPWVIGTLLAIIGGALIGWQAATAATVTPRVKVELGYSDNVRFRKNPRSDAYIKVSPGLSLTLGPPENRLSMSGEINYKYYFRLHEYTQIDGGSLNLYYLRQFSPSWKFWASNTFSSAYDEPVVDEEGRVVRLTEDEGRRDQNRTTVGLEHKFGPMNTIYGTYSYTHITGTADSYQDSNTHQVMVGYTHRLAPNWRTDLTARWDRYNYDDSDSWDKPAGDAVLAYMMGPTREAYVGVGYQGVRTDSDDEAIKNARNYDIYRAYLGYSHDVSPTFGYGFTLGTSLTEADESAYNTAAGQTNPVLDGWVNWKGEKWGLGIYFSSDLNDYGSVGEDTGLTQTTRLSADFSYNLARRWVFTAGATYIHDDYKQRPYEQDITSASDSNTYLARTGLKWQFYKYWSVGLNYLYQERDDVNDNEDRRENRIFLVLTAEQPYLW